MRAFLDACVLYPPLVRALLLSAGEAGLIAPLWSERVLEEWRIAVAAKQGPEAEAAAAAARAAMAERFPGAAVGPGEEAASALPDPADAHVLAAAAAAGADVLVTFNLRDFPARALARHGLAPRHPDSLLWELHGRDDASPVAAAVRRETGERDPQALRRALKRARLPRLGKALGPA